MTSLILNYIKIMRFGIFPKTLAASLLLILPSTFSTSRFIGEYIQFNFSSTVSYIILITIMNGISENRYILYKTLPIKTEDFIKLIYLHSYLIFTVGFVGTVLVTVSTHNQFPMLNLVLISAATLCTNIFYPVSASLEFKLGTYQNGATSLLLALVFIIVNFTGLIYYIAIEKLAATTIFHFELWAVIIIITISIATIKSSYKTMMEKVMGF